VGNRKKIAGEPMKVLLATDGSDCARAAAKSIAGRPWTKGSEIKVLGVADIILPAMEPWYGEPGLFMRLQKEAIEHEQEATAEAAKIVSSTGLTVSTAVLSGNPKAVIVDEAKDWQADLIVVGSYGRTGIDRFLLGSVSAAVAMHAHCSVEIIREPARD
jgi:nucleotide-binding universal stress UspA family protein